MPKAVLTTTADLIPTSEVAAMAKVNPSTVNRWVQAGRLRVVVKGPGRTGPNLFARAEVEALLAEDARSAAWA